MNIKDKRERVTSDIAWEYACALDSAQRANELYKQGEHERATGSRTQAQIYFAKGNAMYDLIRYSNLIKLTKEQEEEIEQAYNKAHEEMRPLELCINIYGNGVHVREHIDY